MRLTPAEYVIRTIGGVRKTARALGRNPGSISMWRSRKPRGGKGDIPRPAQKDILTYARRKHLDITASDLILGRVVNVSKTARS